VVDRSHQLPVVQQCQLLSLNRSTFYDQPKSVSEADLKRMRRIDERRLKRPFYGSRRICGWLRDEGHDINRKHVQRLMRQMRITALYPKKNTSQPIKGHKVYPYRLKGLKIDRPNQVWATDITYIPIQLEVAGFNV
jgi:putative transposase